MIIISDMTEHILKRPKGELFTAREFLGLGTRAAVDQALSRLAKSGLIVRVTRGVYMRPKESPYVGTIMPEPFKIAEAVVKASGATVQINGAGAALRLGLTTQVPTQPVFYTDGPSRRLQMGKLQIVLRRVSPRKLELGNRPAGLALLALWYLGKNEVTPAVIGSIRKKLRPKEFKELKSATNVMPGWMADTFLQYIRAGAQHA
ncbi:MAG: type IV toxin-antitoxin system AbiEi family antitoxin domain-containing protein [Acidobacteria bacterium]|nr:type IV toxin-antitoxin system AbiEi family antitoxin domain-containing protein [Acidobacteriota bacterium]